MLTNLNVCPFCTRVCQKYPVSLAFLPNDFQISVFQQIKQSKAFSFLLWLWKSLGENIKRITALSIYVLSKNDIYHLFFNKVKNMLCYIKQKKKCFKLCLPGCLKFKFKKSCKKKYLCKEQSLWEKGRNEDPKTLTLPCYSLTWTHRAGGQGAGKRSRKKHSNLNVSSRSQAMRGKCTCPQTLKQGTVSSK